MPVEFTRIKLGSVDETGYVGVVDTTYDKLVQVFGEPEQSGDISRTRREWWIMFADGTPATIYDWKLLHIPVRDVRSWNVGGRTKDAWVKVVEALGL